MLVKYIFSLSFSLHLSQPTSAEPPMASAVGLPTVTHPPLLSKPCDTRRGALEHVTCPPPFPRSGEAHAAFHSAARAVGGVRTSGTHVHVRVPTPHSHPLPPAQARKSYAGGRAGQRNPHLSHTVREKGGVATPPAPPA